MRNRQNKVFIKRIQQAKRQFPVFVLAVNRIFADVVQRIVHPAHVPFIAEPEPAHRRRTRNHRPCRRFFCTGHNPRAGAVTQFVHLANKRNRFQIFITAVDIRNPLAGLARIVQIQH